MILFIYFLFEHANFWSTNFYGMRNNIKKQEEGIESNKCCGVVVWFATRALPKKKVSVWSVWFHHWNREINSGRHDSVVAVARRDPRSIEESHRSWTQVSVATRCYGVFLGAIEGILFYLKIKYALCVEEGPPEWMGYGSEENKMKNVKRSWSRCRFNLIGKLLKNERA